MRSESVGVDVEVSGPGPCLEPRYGFLDFKNVLTRFIVSLMKEREKRPQDYIRLRQYYLSILFFSYAYHIWRDRNYGPTSSI